jgi:hypothetical protein
VDATRFYTCVFPSNKSAKLLWLLDVVLVFSLPLISFIWYIVYIKRGFKRDIEKAKFLRKRDEIFVFEQKFVKSLMQNEIDDVLLTLGLLHANVDKYVAMRIVSTFCDMTDWTEPEKDE